MDIRHPTSFIAELAEEISNTAVAKSNALALCKELNMGERELEEITSSQLTEQDWQELETILRQLEQDKKTVQQFCEEHNATDRFLRISNDENIPLLFWHATAKVLENKWMKETLLTTINQPLEELLKTYHSFEFTSGNYIKELRCCIIIFSTDLTASVRDKARFTDKEYSTTLLTLLSGQAPYWLAEHLIKHGTPIPTDDEYPHDPLLVRAHHNLLYSACYWNNHPLVAVLTHTDVYTRCPEDIKTAAFLFSVCRGGYETLAIFEHAGMNPTVIDNQGNNAWHWLVYDAAHNENSRLTERQLTAIADYLRGRVDINAANRNGNTPLHLAVANPRLLPTLIAAGADVYATDMEGNTALHKTAPYCFDLETYGCLFLPLLNHRNLAGYTPLDIALQRGNFKFAMWALKQGADVSLRVNPSIEPITLLLEGLANFVKEHLHVAPITKRYHYYPAMVASAEVITHALTVRPAASIQADETMFNHLLSVITSLARYQPDYTESLRELVKGLRDADGNTIYHYAATHNPMAFNGLVSFWLNWQDVLPIFVPNKLQQTVANDLVKSPALLLPIMRNLFDDYHARPEIALALVQALRPLTTNSEQQDLLTIYQLIAESWEKSNTHFHALATKRHAIRNLLSAFQIVPFNEPRFLQAIKDINDVNLNEALVNFYQKTDQRELAGKIKDLAVKDLPAEAKVLPSLVRTPVTTYGSKPTVPRSTTNDPDANKRCSLM